MRSNYEIGFQKLLKAFQKNGLSNDFEVTFSAFTFEFFLSSIEQVSYKWVRDFSKTSVKTMTMSWKGESMMADYYRMVYRGDQDKRN